MKIARDAKKIEAIDRMKTLGLSANTVKVFDKHDVVRVSEPFPSFLGNGVFGALYDLDENEMKMVREFEERYGALVYHVVRSFTEFGKLDALLYVSDYKEEWGMDRESVKERCPMAYVVNHDADWCSEFGSIGVREAAGGLVREY